MLTLNNNKILTEISNHFSVNSKQHIRLIGFALKEFNQLCRLDQSDATKRSQLKKEKNQNTNIDNDLVSFRYCSIIC